MSSPPAKSISAAAEPPVKAVVTLALAVNTIVLAGISSNLPSVGTGPATSGSANQNSNYGVITGGHSSAVATASQINKVESYRDPDSFADIVRGMQMYGRKILRPEGIVTAKYNAA